MSRPSAFVWHPWLLATYPILLLYSRNANSVYFRESLAALSVVLMLATLGWVALRKARLDPQRAGLLVSATLFLIFSFERNVHAVGVRGWIDAPGLREWVVLLLGLGGLASFGVLLRYRPRSAQPLGTMANVASVVLLGFLGPALLRAVRAQNLPDRPSVTATRTDLPRPWASRPAGSPKPDVYFIVLDAFGRSDVLRSMFDYDNRAWLGRMERRGFYLAGQSTANYCQTALSVTATLSASYLPQLAGSSSHSRIPLRRQFEASPIPQVFRANGYKLVGFATGFGVTDGFPADERWAPLGNLNEFDALVLDMTPLWTVVGAGTGRASHGRHRERIGYLFDHLGEVAADPAPTFCLAHVVAPHPPFVFAADGSDVSGENSTYRLTDGKPWSAIAGHGGPADYASRYRAQAAYVSARVEAVVDQILARSSQPPIIVIQGDHGPGSHFDPDLDQPNDLIERFGILNLILVPGRNQASLYPTITPVNTFRVLADLLFGTQFGLIPDRSYYSSYQQPYQMIEVTDQVGQAP